MLTRRKLQNVLTKADVRLTVIPEQHYRRVARAGSLGVKGVVEDGGGNATRGRHVDAGDEE